MCSRSSQPDARFFSVRPAPSSVKLTQMTPAVAEMRSSRVRGVAQRFYFWRDEIIHNGY
jgi:hypothetical protein